MRAWRAALDPRESAPILSELGFARPEESAGHLLLLARGPEHAIVAPSARRRELLARLGPLLLDEIRELADPDLALMNLASFIAAIGARSSFLELLEQHPATRRVVLSLFASSAYLSTIFIRHPEMIDTLVRSNLARPRRALAELDEELRELMVASADLESRLDAIRAFRHQEFLRIAIADLAGDLDTDAVRAELSLLAEVVLRRALDLARAEVAARIPIPPTMELVALAMGRLGAAEMSYNSDLDLIFVYNDPDETSGGHLASRIVQKLIAVLESRTREGYAYKIDLRLRPSGNAGPLVASLDGFRDYHRNSSAAVWERQALVRARVLAGEPELGAEVEAARREFVFGRGLSRAEVAEIAAMRLRIERELGADGRGRLNIKQGRGGLVDVEFLSQMMALRYGNAHPEVTSRSTIALVRGIGQCGLLEHGAAAQLEADYRFLSRLENRLRIETDQAAWALSTAPESLGPLARRMGIVKPTAPRVCWPSSKPAASASAPLSTNASLARGQVASSRHGECLIQREMRMIAFKTRRCAGDNVSISQWLTLPSLPAVHGKSAHALTLAQADPKFVAAISSRRRALDDDAQPCRAHHRARRRATGTLIYLSTLTSPRTIPVMDSNIMGHKSKG